MSAFKQFKSNSVPDHRDYVARIHDRVAAVEGILMDAGITTRRDLDDRAVLVSAQRDQEAALHRDEGAAV